MPIRAPKRKRLTSAILILFVNLVLLSTASAATLTGPVTWGSPDQAWGMRRPVTAADRTLITAYRSGRSHPILSTKFTSATEFEADWVSVSDDNSSLKACRRPDSVTISPVGLRLSILAANDCRAARWSTGYIASKVKYGYGFFEARMKIADIKGLDNAFWLTTDDHFEIDATETFYPSYMHLALQDWPTDKGTKHAEVGWGVNWMENMSQGFHDVGLLWTPTQIIYEVDGEPIAAVVTHGAVKGPATIRLSTALADWAGGKVPEHPEGHGMVVQSLKVLALAQ